MRRVIFKSEDWNGPEPELETWRSAGASFRCQGHRPHQLSPHRGRGTHTETHTQTQLSSTEGIKGNVQTLKRQRRTGRINRKTRRKSNPSFFSFYSNSNFNLQVDLMWFKEGVSQTENKEHERERGVRQRRGAGEEVVQKSEGRAQRPQTYGRLLLDYTSAGWKITSSVCAYSCICSNMPASKTSHWILRAITQPHLTCARPPRLKKSAGLRQIRRLCVCLLTCVMECVCVRHVGCLPWITDRLSAGCAFLNTKITPSDPLGHRQDEMQAEKASDFL